MGRQRILYYIFIEKIGNTWEDINSCITSLQRKEEIHGMTENPVPHLYREQRKYMGRQRILCHISIEKIGNTWEDRESCTTSLQRKEEIHGKTENPVPHLYREKRKYMGRQRILYHIFIEEIGNTWEDRDSCITSLQRKEEIDGKTENPVLHLYREKRKYMGRQIILYYIFIEKRGNTWKDREACITSLQRKEEIHGKIENLVLHLYREKRKYMGRQRILYYIFIQKRGNTWEDRESCNTSLQRKQEIHGKTDNPVSHLYREKRKQCLSQIET